MDTIGAELDKLEKDGKAHWVGCMIVPKRDGRFVCEDYTVTINPALDVNQYPLPNPTDLFAFLSGGKFTNLGLSQAYLQVLLDETFKVFTTITTHQRFCQYSHLPFGVASAPAIFQMAMDTILQGFPNICYLGGILITGADDVTHLRDLQEVLSQLEHHGLRLKQTKCKFMQDSVEYLGHRVDAMDLYPLDSKKEAIEQAPEPQNVTQLSLLRTTKLLMEGHS